MLKIHLKFKDFWLSGHAATAIEYALIAASVSVAIAGAVYLFGDDLTTLFYDELAGALGS